MLISPTITAPLAKAVNIAATVGAASSPFLAMPLATGQAVNPVGDIGDRRRLGRDEPGNSYDTLAQAIGNAPTAHRGRTLDLTV